MCSSGTAADEAHTLAYRELSWEVLGDPRAFLGDLSTLLSGACDPVQLPPWGPFDAVVQASTRPRNFRRPSVRKVAQNPISTG